jgi:uncharacterized membrane protein
MKAQRNARVGLAGAAALLAIATLGIANPSHAADKEQPGRCYGVNSCKGEGACATAKNDCKGHNQCKGQGVVLKTPAECKALGGTLTEKE